MLKLRIAGTGIKAGNGRRAKKWRFFLILTMAVILFLVVFPYLLPLNQPELEVVALPFENSRVAEVEGVRLHYQLWEPDSLKGQVLLVHGFAGSTFSWRHTAAALHRQGYRVVAADLPAYGYSSRSSGARHVRYSGAPLLWQLLHTIDSTGQWHLAGHSMGAAVAGGMAALRPEQTGLLVLADGGLATAGSGSQNKIAGALYRTSLVQRWAEVISVYALYNPKRFRKLLASAYGREPDEAEVAGYLAPFRIRHTTSAILQSMSGSRKEHQPDYTVLQHQPILIIWGAADAWVPPSTGERLQQCFNYAEMYLIPGAGHCPMETHPDEFNRLLLERLERSEDER